MKPRAKIRQTEQSEERITKRRGEERRGGAKSGSSRYHKVEGRPGKKSMEQRELRRKKGTTR